MTPSARKLIILVVVVTSLSLLLTIPSPFSYAQQGTCRPITKDGLLGALAKKVLSSRTLINEVQRCGVAFELTSTDERKVRRKGAYLGKKGLDDLVAAVRNKYYTGNSRATLYSSAMPTLKSYYFDMVKVDAKGDIKEPSKAQAQYFTEDLGSGVTMDMVQIRGGTFRMGSSESEVRQALEDAKLKPNNEMFNNELPQHEVTVSGFFMSKFEVTQAQWQAVKRMPQVKRSMDATRSQHTGDSLPVEQVWWEEAREFCDRLSRLHTGRIYRLPTEAEWEYACRAGTTTPFTFGETITPDLANYDSGRPYGKVPPREYQGGTLPVGWFRVANGFGLYDMPGNVKEWCLDGWHEDYDGAPTKGGEWWSQSSTLRVARGCSWLSDAFECRCAFRDGIPIDRAPRNNVGFRVVMIEQP